jgi:hypothetical protein
VLIGDDILRNPSAKEVDSTLRAYKKTDVDSVAVVSISEDSAYTFPLTNYQSSLAETRSAGDDRIVSEVTRQSDQKILYKLKVDEFTLNKRNVTAQPTEYAKKLMRESKLTTVQPSGKTIRKNNDTLSVNKNIDDVFQSEFENEKKDSTYTAPLIRSIAPLEEEENSVLASAKLYPYKPKKFSADLGSIGFNSAVLINRYQTYGGGGGPIMLNGSTALSGLVRLSTSDLLDDIKISGAFKLGTNLKDNEWLLNYQNLKRRIDWGLTYYRNAVTAGAALVDGQGNIVAIYPARLFTNLFQGNISYPFDVAKSIRLSTGIRSDNLAVSSVDQISASLENQKTLYSVTHLEFVYDNSLVKATNIMNGLRYKVYIDWNRQVNEVQFAEGPNTFNFGFDGRYYYPIYKNFIWAGRVAGDFSWGNQKFIYYLGGTDGWLMFGDNIKNGRERYFNSANRPANDQSYAFQSLTLNMRGFIQNVANGNNAVVINSEFRLPIMSTFFDKTVNSAFLRDFQITQFIDLGTAWNGGYGSIKRPTTSYSSGNVTVRKKAGGVGPFAGGYGFGARSTLLGYFIRYDLSWPMVGVFKGRPIQYISLGLDF